MGISEEDTSHLHILSPFYKKLTSDRYKDKKKASSAQSKENHIMYTKLQIANSVIAEATCSKKQEDLNCHISTS